MHVISITDDQNSFINIFQINPYTHKSKPHKKTTPPFSKPNNLYKHLRKIKASDVVYLYYVDKNGEDRYLAEYYPNKTKELLNRSKIILKKNGSKTWKIPSGKLIGEWVESQPPIGSAYIGGGWYLSLRTGDIYRGER